MPCGFSKYSCLSSFPLLKQEWINLQKTLANWGLEYSHRDTYILQGILKDDVKENISELSKERLYLKDCYKGEEPIVIGGMPRPWDLQVPKELGKKWSPFIERSKKSQKELEVMRWDKGAKGLDRRSGNILPWGQPVLRRALCWLRLRLRPKFRGLAEGVSLTKVWLTSILSSLSMGMK